MTFTSRGRALVGFFVDQDARKVCLSRVYLIYDNLEIKAPKTLGDYKLFMQKAPWFSSLEESLSLEFNDHGGLQISEKALKVLDSLDISYEQALTKLLGRCLDSSRGLMTFAVDFFSETSFDRVIEDVALTDVCSGEEIQELIETNDKRSGTWICTWTEDYRTGFKFQISREGPHRLILECLVIDLLGHRGISQLFIKDSPSVEDVSRAVATSITRAELDFPNVISSYLYRVYYKEGRKYWHAVAPVSGKNQLPHLSRDLEDGIWFKCHPPAGFSEEDRDSFFKEASKGVPKFRFGTWTAERQI